MESTPHDDESVVGDECHIVSEEVNGPRYDANYPPSEIDSYSNLLLLCRVHHKMIDDQAETFTSEILHQLKANHENWVARALDSAIATDSLAIAHSRGVAFQEVKSLMPELLAKMKADLTREGNEFFREFWLLSKSWVMNSADPGLCYYLEDHANLQGKIHVLENHHFVIDVTSTNVKKYRMTEEFVKLLVTSAP